jgi:DNA-binding winged helix-turn-helix (wHTH) protein
MEYSSRPVRFGAFEVDLSAGELRKHGLRLRLQEQPFLVLAALLEHPGEVVTREELVRRLWPDGTFVDFDRGLNAAVTRLRQALSDSAEAPRYVETVARRGYRLVAAVHTEPESAAPLVISRTLPVRIWVNVTLALVLLSGAGMSRELPWPRVFRRMEIRSPFSGIKTNGNPASSYVQLGPESRSVSLAGCGKRA